MAFDFRYGWHKMLCLLGNKIMPGTGDCQGFVGFFSRALFQYKTVTYNYMCSKCFKFLVKKMTLLLKKNFTTSCGI